MRNRVSINSSRFIDPEAGLLKAPSIFSKTSQGHDVVRARKYKNPSDGLLDYSTIWKIEEDEDATSSAFGSVYFLSSPSVSIFVLIFFRVTFIGQNQ